MNDDILIKLEINKEMFVYGIMHKEYLVYLEKDHKTIKKIPLNVIDSKLTPNSFPDVYQMDMLTFKLNSSILDNDDAEYLVYRLNSVYIINSIFGEKEFSNEELDLVKQVFINHIKHLENPMDLIKAYLLIILLDKINKKDFDSFTIRYSNEITHQSELVSTKALNGIDIISIFDFINQCRHICDEVVEKGFDNDNPSNLNKVFLKIFIEDLEIIPIKIMDDYIREFGFTSPEPKKIYDKFLKEFAEAKNVKIY